MFHLKKTISKSAIAGIVVSASIIVSSIGIGCYALTREEEQALKPYIEEAKEDSSNIEQKTSGFAAWSAANSETEATIEAITEQPAENGDTSITKKSSVASKNNEKTTNKSAAASSSAYTQNSNTGTDNSTHVQTPTAPVESDKEEIEYPYPLEASLGITYDDLDIPKYTDTSGKSTTLKGGGNMKVAANTKKQTINYNTFSNAATNLGFAKYEIRLKDTNELICSTGLVPPGYTVRNFTFNRAFAPGEYKIQIKMIMYSYDQEMRTINNGAVITTMIAEEQK